MISLFLWLAGGFFFLMASFILGVSVMVLPRRTTYRIIRRLFAVLVRIMGIRLTVEGQDYIEPGKTYLIMGNHQSLFDVFVIPIAVPVPFVGLEAAYHFRFPVWGGLIRIWGNIPIQRNDLSRAKAAISLAVARLRRGMSIGVLPEGHRTRDGHVGPFKKGPFHLALGARADILPLGIRGLFRYCPRGSLRLVPGPVHVTIGRPISHEAYRGMDRDELRAHVRKTIMDLAGERS